MCQIEKWSRWREDNTNLAKLDRVLGICCWFKDNRVIHDVQPYTRIYQEANIERLDCPFDVASLADGEILHHPAHCRRLPKRATYLLADNGNKTTKLVRPRDKENEHKDDPHRHRSYV